ncbi:MAG: radical SAM protein [Clostridia bacterium]|nr:radical SAM protein [Clostridia bacterium]
MKEYTGKRLTIMLCSTCNTNCKHCYISYKGNFDTNTLDEVIQNFKGTEFYLNGTEPLMFPQYLKYFKQLKHDFIFTNGKIVYNNPQILDQLKPNGINKVCFSYHLNLQELVSEIPLTQVEDCIKLCQQKGLKVKLLCSLCKTNYKNIEEFCEKAISLGVKEVLLTNFIIQGNAIKNGLSNLALSDSELLEVLTEINRLREKYPKDQLFIERCGSFDNSIQSKKYYCDAGYEDVVITPDLKLYPCIFFAGVKEFEMGYYKNGKFWITKECAHTCDYCMAKRKYNDKLDCSNVFKK